MAKADVSGRRRNRRRRRTTPRVRLLDRMNTWKAFLIVLALCLIIGGFLFYRYQQLENNVAEPPPTAPTSQSFATSAEEGEGGRAETQSEENDAQPDATDHEQQDSSSDLRGIEPVAYPLDPTYEDGYYPPEPIYKEEVAYE
jgi:hypothetical protein